ncbi:MAG: sulfotransferase [Bacteroidia bacterium]|nr:sulfotransferase [Bacteroidia bacterium]MCZ2277230.1 sulfotransferase [Bacteroidia bacterium]
MKEIWPNFLVIGAAKCGTTSLYHYLKTHPEVYMSPIKEPNFFSTDINPDNFSQQYKDIERRKRLNLTEYVSGDMKREIWGYFVKKREHYTALFKNVKGERAIGEISNSYLFSKEAASNISRTLPNVKLIAILRNPVTRMYSHYMANLRDGKTYKSFREEVEFDFNQKCKGWYINHAYVEMGLYYDQVKRFLTTFPSHQIRIYLHDDFQQNPSMVLTDICRFLGIDESFGFNTSERYNEARVPKNKKFLYWLSSTGIKKNTFRILPERIKPGIKKFFFKAEIELKIEESDRQFAYQFYESEIPQLEKLIGRDLTHWKLHQTK